MIVLIAIGKVAARESLSHIPNIIGQESFIMGLTTQVILSTKWADVLDAAGHSPQKTNGSNTNVLLNLFTNKTNTAIVVGYRT